MTILQVNGKKCYGIHRDHVFDDVTGTCTVTVTEPSVEHIFVNAMRDLSENGRNLHDKLEADFDREWADLNMPNKAMVWQERMAKKFSSRFCCIVIDEVDTVFSASSLKFKHNKNFASSVLSTNLHF